VDHFAEDRASFRVQRGCWDEAEVGSASGDDQSDVEIFVLELARYVLQSWDVPGGDGL